MFLISWYIFTHDNSPSTAVRRYISLGFTHNVTKRLATFGYIEKEETTLALKALEEEYAGKCYMWPAKNKDGLFEGTYELYGQRFISYLKIDQRDDKRFTVISIAFVQPDRLITQKEIAYEIPYGVQIGGGVRIHYKAEITAQILSEEVLNHEADYISHRDEDMHQKDITGKWKNILELEKKKINQEKSILTYHNLKINEEDASLEIQINTDKAYELNYTSDDMLQMTTKKKIHHYIDVGHMREFSDGRMIIDMTPQVDYSNIASSGEISISMRMAEIALDRQRKALKSILYKENVNPEISDIILRQIRRIRLSLKGIS